MTHHLENASLQLSIDPVNASWSLFSREWDGASIQGAGLRIAYRRGRIAGRALTHWNPATVDTWISEDSPHGPARSIEFRVGPDPAGIHARLTFSLPLGYPFLLWQVSVTNQGSQPIFIDEIELLRVGYPTKQRSYPDPTPAYTRGRAGPVTYRGKVQPNAKTGALAFLSNGWTSWSRSGLYRESEKASQTRLGFLRRPVTSNAGSPSAMRRGHFTSEMFGVLGNQTHRTAILGGFLSQHAHFGALETWLGLPHPSLRIWAQGDGARLDPGSSISTDWACLGFVHMDRPEPLGEYFDAVSRQHSLPAIRSEIPVGWCSWYYYFERVSAEAVRRNLESAGQLSSEFPFDIIQIDDGFESIWGDWSNFSSRFPEGVNRLAQEIADAGFTPGLWLAPFILHRRSRLARDHPEWLLRNSAGLGANAGFQGDGLATALDLTHEGALAYAAETVHTAVHAWGFPYLKLDFLYAAALPGKRRDPTKTRAQVLRSGLAALREAAGGETYLVGCGSPLGPAIGLLDAMRIGPDVAEHWEPRFRGIRVFFNRESDIPAARNSVWNSLVRANMHGYWWVNDPDCLLLRPETDLSTAEVQLLATVAALTGGSLFVSDDLRDLPADRLELLGKLLPPIGKRPHVLDWFDSSPPSRLQLDLSGAAGGWHLIGLFNLADQPADLLLRPADFYLDPQTDYFASSFWDGRITRVTGEHRFEAVPAHGAVVAALRPAGRLGPEYLGGNLHISQGLEVSGWDPGPGGVRLSLQRPGLARGQILLSLPRPPVEAFQDGTPARWSEALDGVYRFDVEFRKTCAIEVGWG
ncbi:MAG TPA: alpha-galactosidase [Anaerolineales bacterium]|nr:alpha-galactosidase [Anaerolineales bacterium]